MFSTFLTRPLNRSLSQNSSRTHFSTVSAPPSIPSRETRVSHVGSSRPPISAAVRMMPTIPGSSEGHGHHGNVFDDTSSLRADSFMTADSVDMSGGAPANGVGDIIEETRRSRYSLDGQPSVYDGDQGSHVELGRHPSVESRSRTAGTTSTVSESFFARGWRRSEHYYGNAMASFPKLRKPRLRETVTPACWMFWLGFIAPWCWIMGGWYFTIRGETRPKFLGGKGKGKGKDLPLPSWVLEKKGTDNIELSEKEAALHGIWFGYPYVAPSVNSLSLPTSVRSAKQSTPSILDPWIFRCRVAAWTCGALVIIAFVIAFVVVGKRYG